MITEATEATDTTEATGMARTDETAPGDGRRAAAAVRKHAGVMITTLAGPA